MRAYSKFTEEIFTALPELKFLTVMGTGTDNIDLEAAKRHGVVVSNTPTRTHRLGSRVHRSDDAGADQAPGADAPGAHRR